MTQQTERRTQFLCEKKKRATKEEESHEARKWNKQTEKGDEKAIEPSDSALLKFSQWIFIFKRLILHINRIFFFFAPLEMKRKPIHFVSSSARFILNHKWLDFLFSLFCYAVFFFACVQHLCAFISSSLCVVSLFMLFALVSQPRHNVHFFLFLFRRLFFFFSAPHFESVFWRSLKWESTSSWNVEIIYFFSAFLSLSLCWSLNSLPAENFSDYQRNKTRKK